LNLIISFKEFIQDPVKSLLFLALSAILYLYIDNKIVYTTTIEKLEIKIENLEKKIDLLTIQLNKSNSALSAAAARLEILTEYYDAKK
jgi:hypothetical protein